MSNKQNDIYYENKREMEEEEIAHFNKRTGNIEITEEGKAMFKELGSNNTPNGFRNRPWVRDIIKWLTI